MTQTLMYCIVEPIYLAHIAVHQGCFCFEVGQLPYAPISPLLLSRVSAVHLFPTLEFACGHDAK